MSSKKTILCHLNFGLFKVEKWTVDSPVSGGLWGKFLLFEERKDLRVRSTDPHNFSITYRRTTPARLSVEVETEIQTALLHEKQIVEDPNLPISDFNYTALRDRLKNKGIEVSVTTIIDRAKKLGCYRTRKKRKFHDREVPTASIDALVQHDGSSHLWSPFARDKWTLITSIDDFSIYLGPVLAFSLQ